MYFRSRKKLQGEVSLNDSLDSDADGESLYLMDVVGVEDTMYLDIQDRDDCLRVRRLVHECLTEREEEVIISRYGLGGRMPRTQREVAKKLGISRATYRASKSARCKSWRKPSVNGNKKRGAH